MSYITIVLILSCFTLAQLDPRTLPTEEVFGQIQAITRGMLDWYKSQRGSPSSQIPEENQIRNMIDQEMNNLYVCLSPYQESVVLTFRLFPVIFEYLGAPAAHLENADTTYLSEQMYNIFQQGYNAIRNCLSDSIIIGPFMSDLFARVTTNSIKMVLDWMKNDFNTANNYISMIANNYQYSMFWDCGSKFAELYLWGNPVSPPVHENPMDKPNWVLWKFLKETVNGFMNKIMYERMGKYSSDPNEYQVWQSIVNEMQMIKSCIDVNPDPIVSVFRQFGPVFQSLGAPNYNYESADTIDLGGRISSIAHEGIEAIRPCATSSNIIMPYLNEIKNQVSPSSIQTKLNEKKSQSIEINNYLYMISTQFDSWYVYSSGEHLAELYFFFNPLGSSTNHKSPADYTTSELIIQIAEIVNGLVDYIIQNRQYFYSTDPNEPMIAQAIRNEVQSVMNCLQANPEPIANTFRMFVNPFSTLGAPNPTFENADKYTLAYQIYDIWISGYSAISVCLTATPTIQPYLMSMSSSTTSESIFQKLATLYSSSYGINQNLQGVMNNYQQSAYWSVGNNFGQLWFIANPLSYDNPPSPSSPANFTTAELMLQIAEIVNGLVDYIIQNRQYFYSTDPNEPMIAQAIRNEVQSVMNCLQANPEPIANTFRMFVNPFTTLGAPNIMFENADKYTLAYQIFDIWISGYSAISVCLTATPTIQPYLMSMSSSTTSESIFQKLATLYNSIYGINQNLQAVMNNYHQAAYWSVGNNFGQLWFIVNPLSYDNPPSPPSPANFTTAELMIQIADIVNGLVDTIIQNRQYVYYNDPNEPMVAQAIRNEVQSVMYCLQTNPEPIANTFRMFVNPFNTLGAPNPMFENADKYSLANQIYDTWISGYSAISSCLTAAPTIQPYLMSMSSYTTSESILQKLYTLYNKSIEINTNLQYVMTNYQQGAYWSVGANLGQLWFIANPMNYNNPPSPSSPANFSTAELMVQIADIVNGLVDTIIQNRQYVYYSDPNEHMVAQAIRNEVQSVMYCLQANPEPIANTFRMFVEPFTTLGAPNPMFENSDKYTLANQIYAIWMSGYSAITACLTATPTIQPYLMSMSSYTTSESILQKLYTLYNKSIEINSNLQYVMTNYQQGAYWSVGANFGQLWFIANPLNYYNPPSPSHDVTVNGIPVARAEIVMNLYSADNALLKTITLSDNH